MSRDDSDRDRCQDPHDHDGPKPLLSRPVPFTTDPEAAAKWFLATFGEMPAPTAQPLWTAATA
jgi:hypothetical protein